jgi:hypothetical protein
VVLFRLLFNGRFHFRIEEKSTARQELQAETKEEE